MRMGKRMGSIGMGIGTAVAALALATSAQADVFQFQMGDGSTGSAGGKDTWIVMGPASGVNGAATSDTNSGVDPKLRCRSYSSSSGERVILVSFPNLLGTGAGQFDPSQGIQSATLRLTVSTASSATIAAYQLMNDWDEGTGNWNVVDATHSFYGATWNNAKAFPDSTQNVPWTTAWNVDRTGAIPLLTGPVGTQLSKGAGHSAGSLTVEDWDVTQAVKNWAMGQANDGLALWQSDWSNNEFVSRESTAVVGGAPMLIIVTPEPAALGLLAAGSLLALRRRR